MKATGPEPLRERNDHETLLIRRGRRTGIDTIIAVHSTTLGPALGGCRMWSYETLEEAVGDALRLSRTMTLKAAVARLPLGGGKAVIRLAPGARPPRGELREALLRDFAESVQMLAGSYITAEDVGTHASDMALLARWTDHVSGRPRQEGGGGDPGAFTAAGVEAAIRASLREAFGTAAATGRTIAIVGAGSVGSALARRLALAGAELVLADIDPAKQALAEELGARWMRPAAALRAELDVLAPCALGGVIASDLLDELRCRVICGAANNQLAEDELAARLATRGILYAPDFVANAAGLINASLELTGYDTAAAEQRAAGIEGVLLEVFAHARHAGTTPLQAALEIAQQRLGAARADAPSRRTRRRTRGRALRGADAEVSLSGGARRG